MDSQSQSVSGSGSQSGIVSECVSVCVSVLDGVCGSKRADVFGGCLPIKASLSRTVPSNRELGLMHVPLKITNLRHIH